MYILFQEVNSTWAGLGYYSRAKRLHEGAIKVGCRKILAQLNLECFYCSNINCYNENSLLHSFNTE